MFQQFYNPHPALKGFVNYIMIHELKPAGPGSPQGFSIPPLPEQTLTFYVRDRPQVEDTSTNNEERSPASIVVGPNITRHKITPGRDHLIIVVAFQPGGLYRLLGIPMTELLSSDAYDSIDLLGNEIKQVNEQLSNAPSLPEMKTIVEGFLIKKATRLKQCLPIDEVLPLLIKEGGLIKIDQLASQACLSIRQFERVFQQRIGLAPKQFSRLVRFAQAWIMREQRPGISWMKIAHQCGYFDQMHLIRDFQEFAGVNPSVIESELLKAQLKLFNRNFS